MSELGQGPASYLLLLVAGFCATQPWRLLGVLLSRNVSEEAEILVWVRAVSTALVAGLVVRMVLLPAGALAGVPLGIRLGAFALGLAVYYLTGRGFLIGIVSAAAALILAQQLFVAPPV